MCSAGTLRGRAAASSPGPSPTSKAASRLTCGALASTGDSSYSKSVAATVSTGDEVLNGLTKSSGRPRPKVSTADARAAKGLAGLRLAFVYFLASQPVGPAFRASGGHETHNVKKESRLRGKNDLIKNVKV